MQDPAGSTARDGNRRKEKVLAGRASLGTAPNSNSMATGSPGGSGNFARIAERQPCTSMEPWTRMSIPTSRTSTPSVPMFKAAGKLASLRENLGDRFRVSTPCESWSSQKNDMMSQGHRLYLDAFHVTRHSR